MTSDEIKEMFQANASLQKCLPCDPERSDLEIKVASMRRRYISESMVGAAVSPAVKERCSIEQAIEILANACTIASILESKHHPGNIDDEVVKQLAMSRNEALNVIVDALIAKS